MSALLATRGLTAFYGDFQALFGIDFEIHAGEAVAIIGANGAGKSTFLKTVTGLLAAAPDRDRVRRPRRSAGCRPPRSSGRASRWCPKGRRLFPSLSVEENLLIGGYAKRTGPVDARRASTSSSRRCEELRTLPGNALSGGQQQMVAIGRALLSNPRLLICDEISLGLSPLVVIRDIYGTLAAMMREGLTVIVVEQDVGHRAAHDEPRCTASRRAACRCRDDRASSRARRSPPRTSGSGVAA